MQINEEKCHVYFLIIIVITFLPVVYVFGFKFKRVTLTQGDGSLLKNNYPKVLARGLDPFLL